MDTPADIGIRKIEMAVIRDEAEKMGVPGKHWMKIVTQTLKSGGGKVKVIDVKGDYADIVANHPLGHVLGPVKVPTRALRTSADNEINSAIRMAIAEKNWHRSLQR